MHNTSRCAEIDNRFPGLIAAIVNAHNIQLKDKGRRQRKQPKAARRKYNQ